MSEASPALMAAISDEEIAWACAVMKLPNDAFSGSDGKDPRLTVMRSLESLDVEACPGSGKTTLLVAKLAILASRWNMTRRGICVLSHTNAARLEIGDRLGTVSAGHLLLRYPHFVGTIHSFVNEYLAVPWLRSQGRRIKIIDTELAQHDRWRRLPSNTRRYLERQHKGASSLSYTRADFTGGGKEDYSSGSDTYQLMLKACRQSSDGGYFSYDEMFVWASDLLVRFPTVIATIRERFPIVFIDEVQDNSELQSAFIHRLFVEGGRPVVRQRFGDSNQAIYHRTGSAAAVTDVFPGTNRVDLPNSFRFGTAIADVAAPLGVCPQPLQGLGPTRHRVKQASCPNALFLFDDQSVLGVLPAYAEYLVTNFSADALARGDFTAVAGVHKAEKDDHLPRFMGHYEPNYSPEIAGTQPKPISLFQFLARARLELAKTRNTHVVANACAEGLLAFLRLAGRDIPLVLRKSAHRYVLDVLHESAARSSYLALVDRLIASRCQLSSQDWRVHVVSTFNAIGEAVLGHPAIATQAAQFLEWAEADAGEHMRHVVRKVTNLFLYPYDEPKVSIRLASIHAVKGETHTATLVLESFHMTHHLKKLLPWLLGKKPKAGGDNRGEDDALLERLKLHYVAMTRPSHMLCVAMRRDSFKPAELEALHLKDWCIVNVWHPHPGTQA